MTWLLVFLAVAAMDFVWAQYNMATVQGRTLTASFLAMAIICLSGFSIIEYTKDMMLLLPASAGAFIGTLFAMEFKRK